MKISEILNNNKVTVSFEMFPPKQLDKIEKTKAIVGEMVKFKPSFMSVTYGAAGTTSGFTTEIANEIKKDGVEPLSHLTCLTSTTDKIHTVVNTVVSTVISTEFDSVSKGARSELININFWYNRLWPKLVAVVILVVLTILAVLHYRKLQKQALMGTASANVTHIFETPSADDIFTFKD